MNDLQLKKKETRKITNGYYEGRKNALGLTGADCRADQVPNLKCIEKTSPYTGHEQQRFGIETTF